VLGSIGAFFAARAIAAQLYGVKPVDPVTYAVACVALFALTLLASYVPARRAARVDPLLALRAD
jgi:putative ABC transport system permease protein